MKVKRNSFEEGVLYAAAEIVRIADQPSIAADLIVNAGLKDANVSNLDDFEKIELKKLLDENKPNGKPKLKLTGL